jgi:plasmid replication initiation protein
VDKDSINKLKEDLDNFWGDLTDRINAFINKTRSQENAFYRTYEIKLSVRTQQLTLLSIIVAIIIYLLTTLPSAFR